MYLEFYTWEHGLFNLNFKNDDSGTVSNYILLALKSKGLLAANFSETLIKLLNNQKVYLDIQQNFLDLPLSISKSFNSVSHHK